MNKRLRTAGLNILDELYMRIKVYCLEFILKLLIWVYYTLTVLSCCMTYNYAL